MGEYLSVTRSNLWMVDVATGAKTKLNNDPEEVSYEGGRFSEDGSGFYVTTDKGGEFKRLAFWNLATNKLELLTEQIPWDVEGFDLSKDGKSICFVTNEAGVSRAYVMDMATRKYRQIEGLPNGVIAGGAWHENNHEVAFSISSARSTSDVYTWDAVHEQGRTLDGKRTGRAEPGDAGRTEIDSLAVV